MEWGTHKNERKQMLASTLRYCNASIDTKAFRETCLTGKVANLPFTVTISKSSPSPCLPASFPAASCGLGIPFLCVPFCSRAASPVREPRSPVFADSSFTSTCSSNWQLFPSSTHCAPTCVLELPGASLVFQSRANLRSSPFSHNLIILKFLVERFQLLLHRGDLSIALL